MIRSGNLLRLLTTTLQATELPPSLIELEVTEDILLADSESVFKIFRQVRNLGVRTVFDDFGTGYASLSFLRKFPLDGLKIDRSFVMGLQKSSADAAIVECTIALAKQLGLSVIAEGIEEDVTAHLVAKMGCDDGQGYHYGKPMPAADFDSHHFLSQERKKPTERGCSVIAYRPKRGSTL